MKKAFTLAEVLITLGIIGIVAAMTLPALMADYRAKELEVRFKKAYSTIWNIHMRMINDYDGVYSNFIISDLYQSNDSALTQNMKYAYFDIDKTDKIVPAKNTAGNVDDDGNSVAVNECSINKSNTYYNGFGCSQFALIDRNPDYPELSYWKNLPK